MPNDDALIPPHGGYRNLRSFQTAQLVYDATVVFCNRFINKRSRTHDQMVQAARSGVQNIAEASMASGTSKKFEIKLTGVARASLEELLLDYEDFLRQHNMRRWHKESPEALAVRWRYRLLGAGGSDRSDQSDSSDRSDRSDRTDRTGSPHPDDPYGIATATPMVAANTLICLIHQASYLLRLQLKELEATFLSEGGFTERLYQKRQGRRGRG